MRISTINESQRKAAKVVGLAYLFGFVAVFNGFYVRSRLIVFENAPQTPLNILAHERLFRFGTAAFLYGCWSGRRVYWGASDAKASLERLLSLGTIERTAVQDVGEGIRVAKVLDPFGNVLGIIENPHFKLSSDDRNA